MGTERHIPADENHGFGETRLQPHAALINDKNRLGYAITDLVDGFCKRHDFTRVQVTIKVGHAGCWAEVTI
jgi:hypothetical protein